MTFSFLHAADLHLDSPLRGLRRYPDMPEERIRGATRKALTNLVDVALEREVDFVLLAGDLYDGDWRDYNTGLFFVRQMARLAQANVPVFVVSGNHDAKSLITSKLSEPGNVVRFSTRRAQTRELPDLGVRVHGRGFSRRTQEQNLAADYPPGKAGWFDIGLLHTSLDGRPGHDPYAPCSLDDLAAKNYQYWALGHVHHREVVCDDPPVVFAGNVQGRHIRETGARGATLVTVEDQAVLPLEFVPLDVLRWVTLSVDATDAGTPDDVLDRVTHQLALAVARVGDRAVVARVQIDGACPAHEALNAATEHWTEEVRARAAEVSPERLWLEKVRVRTRPAVDLEQALDGAGPLGELMRAVAGLKLSPELTEQLTGDLDPLTRKTARALGQADPPHDPTSDDALAETLDRAKDLLLSRLSRLDRAEGDR